jgi:hypothetical protein
VVRIFLNDGHAMARMPRVSIMCSIPGDGRAESDEIQSDDTRPDEARPDEIERLGAAIDELARAASEPGLTGREVAERLARVWELVASLDPELARRIAKYAR